MHKHKLEFLSYFAGGQTQEVLPQFIIILSHKDDEEIYL